MLSEHPQPPIKVRIFNDLSTKRNFKQKRFDNSNKKMTLVIAVKSKEGMIMQSDTLFKDEYEYAEQGTKIFTIQSKENASVFLGLGGRRDLFEDVVSIFTKNFVHATRNGGISEANFKGIVRKCRNEMVKLHNVDLAQMGLEPKDSWDNVEFAGIVGGCVLEDNKPKFVLHKFNLSGYPESVQYYHAIGHADNEAHLLMGKIFPSFFRRYGINWDKLSIKLVSQLTMFVMKYVSRNDASLDRNTQSLMLTADQCVSLELKNFFPESVKISVEKRDYLPEMMETIMSEIPDFIKGLTKNLNEDQSPR
jgi:hypothetical protein